MAIEHLLPTEATVKYLYAHAFGCAFEGCRRPLYRIDDETGIRTLNSRICHIHARREGGPRWEPDQSSEDNRSEGNLVLMCVEHAAVIDIPETLSSYPAERLRDWKQKQLQDHDRIRQGWFLDAEMAEEVIAASATRAEILIRDSIIKMGGEGGRGVGAGGGGGGAMGRNARGGRGGAGGEHRVDQGEFTLPLPVDGPKHLEPDELTAMGINCFPGAGGGGAGAVGDGAIGGDGGGGGDIVSALIDISELRRAGLHNIELVVGEGGEAGRDGGDTIMRFLTEDGKVLKTLRASGGKAGGAMAPQGCSEIGWRDIVSNFRVSMLLTANALEIRDGLLFMLGAGWHKYAVPGLPFDAVWPVGCSFQWEAEQWSEPRVIQVSILRPDGSNAATESLTLAPENGITGIAHVGCALGVKLDSYGAWSILLHSGNVKLAQFSLTVTAPPSLQS